MVDLNLRGRYRARAVAAGLGKNCSVKRGALGAIPQLDPSTTARPSRRAGRGSLELVGLVTASAVPPRPFPPARPAEGGPLGW